MARNAEQNQQIKDERQQQILSCAVKLFATRGLAATRVSDIAKAVGMSQGLLYHYYPSKEDIFVDIVRMAFLKMNAAARALETQKQSVKDKLGFAVPKILNDLERSEDFAWYSTLITMASISDAIPPEAAEIIRKEREVPYLAMTRIFRQGQKEGSVRQCDAKALSLVFWSAIKGLALQKTYVGKSYRSPDASVLLDLIFEEKTS